MTTNTVEVRIRHEDEFESRAVVGRFTLDQLDDLIDDMGRWGLYPAPSGGQMVPHDASLSGQFVYNELTAFFEIVIGRDE